MRWAVVAGATAHLCSSHTTTRRLSWDPSPPPAMKSWYSTGAPVKLWHALKAAAFQHVICVTVKHISLHAVYLTCSAVLADRHRKFAASSNPTVFAPPLLLWLPKEDIARSLESAQAVRRTIDIVCVAHPMIRARTSSDSVVKEQIATPEDCCSSVYHRWSWRSAAFPSEPQTASTLSAAAQKSAQPSRQPCGEAPVRMDCKRRVHHPTCSLACHCHQQESDDTSCSPLKRRRVDDTSSAGNGAAAADAPGISAANATAADSAGGAAAEAAVDVASGDQEMVDMADGIEDVAALPPQVPTCCWHAVNIVCAGHNDCRQSP
jgi:hypothetical protein